MSDLGRVVVLAGGLSHERDVSLRSGRRIADALRAIDVDVEVLDVDGRLLAALTADRPDVVFPALHGSYGEDGAVRDVLELLGIPYVGSRPDASRLTFDKPMAKAALRAAGVRTPDSVTLPQDTFRDLGAGAVLDAIVARLGLPLFVKPARGGSALGASVARTLDELSSAMVGAFAYGDVALVETYLEGTEVAVSVVDTGDGPTALPVVEIVPDTGVYDYTARYTAGMTEFFAPSRLAPEAAQAAVQAALTAHQVLRLRDVSRTDLIVDAEGTPWFLEANVAPGMTETSLLPLAIAAAGLDAGILYRELLHRAAKRG
ncbi:D-alanine--D-alanine ligase family protein [Yinghuangia seranimata]|uniref:D-alanine--D-alanine ligase family protein n=1 Tax=Yinghuangia seranimata TaxID=408067 RepID=UPI00248C7489|nr:D-alanine--D-alanine ligase [Yinghuangia seranimata]MDI2130481.1 D-alanine--D-alanine ligase [Yinghuangia seranimata]